MPASVNLGFQAVILCGTGANLYPFTQAEDMPKALLPLANRPMIYYSLDWCEKAGVQSILILSLQEHLPLIQQHFRSPAFTSTSLSHILSKRGVTIQFEAPSSLNDNLQSADILRVANSKGWIKGDFVVLPCDFVAQGLGLQQIAQIWMIEQGAFGGGGSIHRNGEDGRDGRRGLLGVWYGVGGEGAVKGQETDLLIIAPKRTNPNTPTYDALIGGSTLNNLLQTMPPHALKGVTDSSDFPVRHTLLERHPRAQIRCNSHRDAHIYILPHWVLDFIAANPRLSSLKDDVIPWLAKCGWQNGLGEKMGLQEILSKRPRSAGNDGADAPDDGEEEFDVGGRSTTQITNLRYHHRFSGNNPPGTPPHSGLKLASRVPGGPFSHSRTQSRDTTGASSPTISSPQSMTTSLHSLTAALPPPAPLIKRIPRITAYLTPAEYFTTAVPAMPYVRRVDTPQLFLSVNLHLARSEVALPGQPATSVNTNDDVLGGASAAAPSVQPKIDPTCNISSRTTITSSDCLLGANCTVMEKCVIKRCVLGPNCVVNKGAKLTGCVLLEGCVIEEDVKLDGCILGKNARVGKDAVLKECEVGHGYVVDEGTEAKGERLVLLEGIEGGEAGGTGWGSDDLDEDDYSDSEEDEEEHTRVRGKEGGEVEGDEEEEEEEESEGEEKTLPKKHTQGGAVGVPQKLKSPTPSSAAAVQLPASPAPPASLTAESISQQVFPPILAPGPATEIPTLPVVKESPLSTSNAPSKSGGVTEIVAGVRNVPTRTVVEKIAILPPNDDIKKGGSGN